MVFFCKSPHQPPPVYDQNPRKNFPHMFRVDLADRPGGGESKYKLAAATEGEAEDWKQALAQEVR